MNEEITGKSINLNLILKTAKDLKEWLSTIPDFADVKVTPQGEIRAIWLVMSDGTTYPLDKRLNRK